MQKQQSQYFLYKLALSNNSDIGLLRFITSARADLHQNLQVDHQGFYLLLNK